MVRLGSSFLGSSFSHFLGVVSEFGPGRVIRCDLCSDVVGTKFGDFPYPVFHALWGEELKRR